MPALMSDDVSVDFITNGNPSGDLADLLMEHDFDIGALRPFRDLKTKRSYVTLTRNGKPQTLVTNTNATLTKDEWIQYDTAIIKAAKDRLQLVRDLRSGGLTYSIPNGMGKTVLQYQTQSDITEADMSMDGLRRTEQDRPEYDLLNLPLPIIHKEWEFSLRELQESRSGNAPLDMTNAELAARRVAEKAENLVAGSLSWSYGGGTIYGYTNYPKRITYSVKDPSQMGWTAEDLIQDVLAMRQASQNAKHYGPWVLYFSTDWDQYLDEDYSASKGDNTVRERLAKIRGISSVETADYLPQHTVLLVQKTSDTARLVVGMDFMSLQWDTKGGLSKHFWVGAILVPQLRCDQYENCGIVHGSY